MFKIIVERECGCFKRSNLQSSTEIASKDEALMKSLEMVNHMNDEFCGKHKFKVEEADNTFIIKMQ
ncbi:MULTISPECIES: hypothetical protein [Sulfurimonas]|uniref:hypothetical protein n=1 Tax=Sulfurimonas TaxID=202746 RepID=UPI00125F84F6|nr:hypothetical protein [Sulfurimonas hydrogeniphila]